MEVGLLLLGTLMTALFGVQTFWINRSLSRLEVSLDGFKDQTHRDLQAQTAAIADLRERVARLEH